LINIKLLHPNATIPTRKHSGDSGADLAYPGPGTMYLDSLETRVIPTGIAIELPPGTEAQVRPRSSISKRGLLVHLGTVDNGYRGEIGVIISNISNHSAVIRPGDRIAQLVVAPVLYPKFREVDELDETERGDGGFGSTGT
jgi:dUTP pyrophosphatase